jgi:uncharacterized protein
MRFAPLALCLALLIPLSATADTREERLAVATSYVEATLADMDMAAMIDTMWMPVVQQVEASGATVSQSQRDALKALYMREFEEPMFIIMRAQPEVLADIMTLAELTAMRDFYATPEGRSAMMKLPQLVAAQQPQIMALVTENLPKIMPELQSILTP